MVRTRERGRAMGLNRRAHGVKMCVGLGLGRGMGPCPTWMTYAALGKDVHLRTVQLRRDHRLDLHEGETPGGHGMVSVREQPTTMTATSSLRAGFANGTPLVCVRETRTVLKLGSPSSRLAGDSDPKMPLHPPSQPGRACLVGRAARWGVLLLGHGI